MKKLLLSLAIVLFCASFAVAQVEKPFNAYAGGGLTMPMGDAGEDLKIGFHGMAGLGFNILPVAQAVGKVEYHTLGLDWGELEDVGGSFKVTMYGVSVKMAPPTPLAPMKFFGLIGAGMASYKLDPDADVTMPDLSDFAFGETTDTETEMYYEVGGGIEVRASATMKFFVMARYVSIASDGTSTNFVPITVGLKF